MLKGILAGMLKIEAAISNNLNHDASSWPSLNTTTAEEHKTHMHCEPPKISLPHDIFQSHILPDILSDHLHRLLVAPEAPTWHAFYVLPLVSYAFRETCQTLYVRMFGLESDEDANAIDEQLSCAESLWTRAKQPPERSLPLHQYTYSELMGRPSLIRVYMCCALARSFLNLDVLWHLVLEARATELELDDDDWGAPNPGVPSRRFKMRDDTMHRVYLPLTCAMKLCDSIRPERLAYIVADYLAELVPVYATAPVVLKYTQDLESYVSREHRVDTETWVTWTRQTLGLLEGTERLLIQMQGMGRLVKSFKRSSAMPWDVVHATNIIKVLRDVVGADWGNHTEEIRGRARALLDEWTPAE